MGSVGGGASAGLPRLECSAPSQHRLIPSHYPHLGSFIISETHNSLPCANPLTPSTSNCFYILPSVGSWETAPLHVPYQAEARASSPLISRCSGYHSRLAGCTDIISISRLDIHHPGRQIHLVPQITLIVRTSRPTTRAGTWSRGSGQEVRLVRTQPDVNPTRTNLNSSDIVLIGCSLTGRPVWLFDT